MIFFFEMNILFLVLFKLARSPILEKNLMMFVCILRYLIQVCFVKIKIKSFKLPTKTKYSKQHIDIKAENKIVSMFLYNILSPSN